MRIIKIKGRGVVKAKPDIIEFSLEFNSKDKKYETAVNKDVEYVDKFFKILSDNEIDKEKFKTLNYNIIPYKESVFTGYQVTRIGSLKIKLDFNLLESLIYKFEQLGIKARYNFTIEDRETIKKEAMRQAYNNAYEKAVLLAEVSGTELDGYEEISYDVPYNYNLYSEAQYNMREMAVMGKSKNINLSLADTFNINDIEVVENIFVVWKVK